MTENTADRRTGRPAVLTGSRARLTVTLGVIVACQLMVIVDATIVNIALPRIQADLHFSSAGLAWVQSAYSLAFGGLLLLGGRSGDVAGRRRLFVAGLALFTVASLAAGLANTAGLLIAARVLQGVGAAFAAPASLALLAAAFPDGPERRRALGVFSMIAGLGLSIGLILGGALTSVSWRWVFIINIPVGLAAIALARPFLPETERHQARFDIPGALISTAGVGALAYGFIRAASAGWSDPVTLGGLGAGAVLLCVLVVVERRAEQPVIPLRLLADASRAGAYANTLLLAAGMGSTFFFLSIYVQDALGFSPLRAGLAFLPMAVPQFAAARLAPRLVARYRPKTVTLAGAAIMLAASIWLTQLSRAQGYPATLIGPLILFGVGVGLAFMPLNMLILAQLPPRDTGSASGLLQCLQQLGVALGVAVLATVYATTLHHHAGPHAVTHAVATAFIISTSLIAAAVVVALTVIGRTGPSVPAPATPRTHSPGATGADPGGSAVRRVDRHGGH